MTAFVVLVVNGLQIGHVTVTREHAGIVFIMCKFMCFLPIYDCAFIFLFLWLGVLAIACIKICNKA